MTRHDMRRLDATDDPRPMSVPLQPLNKQLSMKDEEKRRRKTESEKVFQRDEHEVFFLKKINKEHEQLF